MSRLVSTLSVLPYINYGGTDIRYLVTEFFLSSPAYAQGRHLDILFLSLCITNVEYYVRSFATLSTSNNLFGPYSPLSADMMSYQIQPYIKSNYEFTIFWRVLLSTYLGRLRAHAKH